MSERNDTILPHEISVPSDLVVQFENARKKYYELESTGEGHFAIAVQLKELQPYVDGYAKLQKLYLDLQYELWAAKVHFAWRQVQSFHTSYLANKCAIEKGTNDSETENRFLFLKPLEQKYQELDKKRIALDSLAGRVSTWFEKYGRLNPALGLQLRREQEKWEAEVIEIANAGTVKE